MKAHRYELTPLQESEISCKGVFFCLQPFLGSLWRFTVCLCSDIPKSIACCCNSPCGAWGSFSLACLQCNSEIPCVPLWDELNYRVFTNRYVRFSVKHIVQFGVDFWLPAPRASNLYSQVLPPFLIVHCEMATLGQKLQSLHWSMDHDRSAPDVVGRYFSPLDHILMEGGIDPSACVLLLCPFFGSVVFLTHLRLPPHNFLQSDLR